MSTDVSTDGRRWLGDLGVRESGKVRTTDPVVTVYEGGRPVKTDDPKRWTGVTALSPPRRPSCLVSWVQDPGVFSVGTLWTLGYVVVMDTEFFIINGLYRLDITIFGPTTNGLDPPL